MIPYSEAELGIISLWAVPGGLRPRRYWELQKALRGLGTQGQDTEELGLEELKRLGCPQGEAAEILARLQDRAGVEAFLRGLQRAGVGVLTCLDPWYPERLRRLGERAPVVLFFTGNVGLLARRHISLVGSRQLEAPGRRFAETAGRAIASQGFGYCSGGAAGADTVGLEAALEAGGTGTLFLAGSLLERSPAMEQALAEGRLLLLAEEGADMPFSNRRALSRNRLIHALGEKVLVAQTADHRGGTWKGTVDNLHHDLSPVFMAMVAPENPGTRALLAQGAQPVALEELTELENLGDRGLF